MPVFAETSFEREATDSANVITLASGAIREGVDTGSSEGTAMKSGLGTSPKSVFIISPCYQVQHGGYNNQRKTTFDRQKKS